MEKIKIHFDKIFDLLWQEGFVKRYDGIYLITSLLYLKSLEDMESVNVGNRIGEESVFVVRIIVKDILLLSKPQGGSVVGG